MLHKHTGLGELRDEASPLGLRVEIDAYFNSTPKYTFFRGGKRLGRAFWSEAWAWLHGYQAAGDVEVEVL